jgi:2-polyprenyl-6-methoxyphenol hydroxylase-like FAD-dependent oxidoreductase
MKIDSKEGVTMSGATEQVQVEVLVAGAGPAGLTMACELARHGVSCLLVDREPGPFGGSRGKGLQPRTQEIFEDLGLLAEVRAHGGLYPPLQARSGGQVVFEGRMDPLREVTPDVPYPNVWMLPQWRTGELLGERLARLGGSVQYGTELVSVSQSASEVRAVLRHAGRDQVVLARYLVGADGGHSMVRRSAGIGFAGQTREEERMIVADVRADGVSREFWQVWTSAASGPQGFRLGLCPLAGTDTFQLTAPVPPGQAMPDLTLTGIQQLVDEAAGPGQIRVTALTWASLWRANIRMAEEFRAGRIFLVGDAAHVHSPAGGQGLNTGIQDSYNLGWKLAAALAGAPDWLLDSYEAERLPVAADVLGISTRLHDKAVAGESDAHLRDDPELRQLKLGYRSSPLSSENRAAPGMVLAGDRAPDAPGQDSEGKAIRMLELIHGGQLTLLAFGPGSAALAAGLVAERPAAPVRIVEVLDRAPAESSQRSGGVTTRFADTDGEAHRSYDIAAGQDVLLAVRPDGYLGLGLDAGPAAAGQLRAYLGGLCPAA